MKQLFLPLALLLPPTLANGFGLPGLDGQHGSAGLSGGSGNDVVIVATGQHEYYDVSGQDGAAGENGTPGTNATHCQKTEISSHTVYGASGGTGGFGGDGGHGGDGGNATIYFKDILDLQKLVLRSAGGEGGPPGIGAFGGKPCACSLPLRPSTDCDSMGHCSTFYCVEGRRGSDGSEGRWGSNGVRGAITLIHRLDTLPADRPMISTSVGRWHSDGKLTLSRHRYSTWEGANRLLAEGSRVADVFRKYEGTLEWQVELDWPAKDRRQFEQTHVSVVVAGRYPSETPALTFGPHVSVSGHWEKSGDSRFIFRVHHAQRLH